MSRNSDFAEEYFKNGFNCSQAVFSAYSKQLGLEENLALKIAGGFGAGMGRIGETCGAVTGAIMVIGLRYGMTNVNDDQAREKTYELVQEFTKRFKSIHGSVKCKDLLKYDISIPEESKKARDEGITKKLCPNYVRSAAEIIGDILLTDVL